MLMAPHGPLPGPAAWDNGQWKGLLVFGPAHQPAPPPLRGRLASPLTEWTLLLTVGWTPPPPTTVQRGPEGPAPPPCPAPPRPLLTHLPERPGPPRPGRPRSRPRARARCGPASASWRPSPTGTGRTAKPDRSSHTPPPYIGRSTRGWHPLPTGLPPPPGLRHGLVGTGPSCCPGNLLSQRVAAQGLLCCPGPLRGADPAPSPPPPTRRAGPSSPGRVGLSRGRQGAPG